MGSDTTTVEIEKPTRRRLKVWKSKQDMTYDSAINHLLDEVDADTVEEIDG